MVTVTEAFTAANGTALSTHNAAFVAVMGAGAFSIESNRLRCDDWTNVASRYNGSGIGSNQYAECVIRGTAEAFRWMGVIARCASGAATFYAAYYEASSLRLSKFVAGSETILGANNSFTPSDGDVVRLECSGTTIRVLVNDTEEASATDSDITAGDPGVFGNGGSATTRIDDWEAGDLSGPDVTPPTITNRSAGTITSNAATITWNTDEDATSFVDYGTSAGNYDSTESVAGLRQAHSVVLLGLPSGVTIHYRVRSADAAGNESEETGTFTTATGGPSSINSVVSSRITSCTARITFSTAGVRAPTVEYGYAAGQYTESTGVLPGAADHDVRLRGMPQGRTVHYRITADGAPDHVGSLQLEAWPSTIPLGVNLSELTHTALSKDHQKFARPWLQADYDEWVHGNGAGELPVDADGWPTTIPAEGVQTILHGATPGTTLDYPLGDYRFEWEGTGTIQVFVGGETIESGANFLVLRVTERTQDGIQYRILTTGTGGNHLRRLKVLEPGNWSTSVEHSNRLSDYMSPYRAGSRYMDTHDTNEKGDRPPAVSWAGTNTANAGNTSVNRYTFHHGAAYGGFPYARSVAISNALNQPGWWCVPHTFSETDIRELARFLRDNLTPGLKCRIEHSNETWNGTFLQGAYCAAQGAARSYPGNSFEQQARYHGARTVEIADWFLDEWPANRHADLEFVLGAWAGVSGYVSDALDQIGAAGHAKLTAIAIGNYIGEYLGTDGYVATTKTYDNDQLHEECRRHLYDTSTIGSGATEVSGVIKRIRDNKAEADAAGLELWAYEGGQHLVGVLGNENDQALTDIFLAYNRSGLAGDLEAEMYDVWRQEGGTVFMRFNSIGPFTKFGSWASQERQDEPNAKQIVSESLAAGPSGTPGRAWNRFEFGHTFKF